MDSVADHNETDNFFINKDNNIHPRVLFYILIYVIDMPTKENGYSE